MNDDLSLVLPDLRAVQSFEIAAYARGDELPVDDAIEQAAAMIRRSKAPAVVGLGGLTIEAARAAASLPCRFIADTRTYTVQQSATLGHVLTCDFVIQPGPAAWAAEHPVAVAIAERVPYQIVIPPDLDSLLQLRAKGAAGITEVTQRPVQRLAVVLPPDFRVEVISQWHKFAADLQTQIRTCVFVLPDLTRDGNVRGAVEAITWMTGKPPRSGGFDLAIDTGFVSGAHGGIRIGPQIDADADLSFVIPGLAWGLHAHVMRCDGIVLPLFDDESKSQPDPCVGFLQRLAAAL